jgi:hypothetical protein
MSQPDPKTRARWELQAAAKDAIVPEYFEVFPDHVIIVCGCCGKKFQRNLIPNVNEPTFVCPEEACAKKNWVPVRFKLHQ